VVCVHSNAAPGSLALASLQRIAAAGDVL